MLRRNTEIYTLSLLLAACPPGSLCRFRPQNVGIYNTLLSLNKSFSFSLVKRSSGRSLRSFHTRWLREPAWCRVLACSLASRPLSPCRELAEQCTQGFLIQLFLLPVVEIADGPHPAQIHRPCLTCLQHSVIHPEHKERSSFLL